MAPSHSPIDVRHAQHWRCCEYFRDGWKRDSRSWSSCSHGVMAVVVWGRWLISLEQTPQQQRGRFRVSLFMPSSRATGLGSTAGRLGLGFTASLLASHRMAGTGQTDGRADWLAGGSKTTLYLPLPSRRAAAALLACLCLCLCLCLCMLVPVPVPVPVPVRLCCAVLCCAVLCRAALPLALCSHADTAVDYLATRRGAARRRRFAADRPRRGALGVPCHSFGGVHGGS